MESIFNVSDKKKKLKNLNVVNIEDNLRLPKVLSLNFPTLFSSFLEKEKKNKVEYSKFVILSAAFA